MLFSFSKVNQIEEKAEDVPNEVLKGAVIKWVRRKITLMDNRLFPENSIVSYCHHEESTF